MKKIKPLTLKQRSVKLLTLNLLTIDYRLFTILMCRVLPVWVYTLQMYTPVA